MQQRDRKSGSGLRIKVVCAVAAVVLVALAVPIFSLLGSSPEPSPDSLNDTTRLASDDLDDTDRAPEPPQPQTIQISLVGDVNLADGWGGDVAHQNNDTVAVAFSPEILEQLQTADICYANHEFTMSSRGEPLSKYYTFCADPSRVGYWEQLGVDVVGLANNHAYDYGEDAFLDTLDLLSSNDIKYVGAGTDLSEAMAPVYFTVADYTVALVAADRSQKGSEPRAQAAGQDTPGVLFCFEDELFLTAVAHAHQTADFVIAIPHWGTEESTVLEPEQIALGHKLIDAGADAVVGSHPHILQGVEYYQGKLIAYSLGNFWFNYLTTPTAILNIEITEEAGAEAGEKIRVPRFRIIGALQSEQQVLGSEEISDEVLELMRQLSPEVTIDNEGYVSAGQAD